MDNGINFEINKSFGCLQLLPEASGIKLVYMPVVDGEPSSTVEGWVELMVPLKDVGGLWATARAFLYGLESLDEDIILPATKPDQSDILIKLYRDKPRGVNGRLSGEEICWLRIVTGRTEEQRRRIKLGPRDLLCIELACNAVLSYSSLAMFTGKTMPPNMPRVKPSVDPSRIAN